MSIKPTELELESRASIPTAEAAAHLSRKPQTLRWWASRNSGPLLPIRIEGRLHWPVEKLRALLGLSRAAK
jgi:hypothetical protein